MDSSSPVLLLIWKQWILIISWEQRTRRCSRRLHIWCCSRPPSDGAGNSRLVKPQNFPFPDLRNLFWDKILLDVNHRRPPVFLFQFLILSGLVGCIPYICPFWYTTILFRPVKSTPKSAWIWNKIFFATKQRKWKFGVFWSIWCFFLHIWCFFSIVGGFWRIWCFALRHKKYRFYGIFGMGIC